MKLLFCVDHLFQRSPEGIVFTTGGKFPYAKWKEYLDYFDDITVAARGQDVPADRADGLAVSSGPGVEHLLFGAQRGLSRLATIGKQRAAFKHLVDDADAVIGRVPSELGLAACSYASAAGKPYLLELVACPWDALWNHGSTTGRLYAPIMAHRTRRAARTAPLVHYVTREFLQRRYPTDGEYVCASNVMLPIPESDLLDRRKAALGRAWSGDRPIVFGTIGSMLTSLKGIDVAIKALARLHDRVPPFVYHILGEGDPADLAALATRLGIGDRVKFDGVLPGAAEVAGWLDGIDVYLQPSYQEGLPRAMIEAMNRACLVIGSTAGGIGELIPPDRMHPPGDMPRLAERIETVLARPADAAEAEAARNLQVAQRYSYVHSLAEKRRAYQALRDWVDTGALPSLAQNAGVDLEQPRA